MGANREYKDSVFTKLFSDPELLLELYNAIEGSSYGLDTKIEINTLEDVLFLEQLNDISFTIDEKLVVLIEHQATLNANMPLRLLLYIARVYEKLIDDRAVYKQGLIKIPTPEFIVLYNGKRDFSEERILRLSDAFIESAAVGNLELTVRVININQGHNEGIVKKSDTLNGYVTFIAKVRENQDKGMELTEAIKDAVKYCTGKHILQKFLTEHSKEVLNMLTTEFNLKDAQ
ncbi:MAG: Rpn family recombination-promoting nuclease/putative transposase, partial [Oscillospiraceae bacterium]|nr:Rpn family recombination-promoting nuclease/putative transposase [Oscillospiraceae bacterium]